MKTGVTYECAVRIFIASLNSFSNSTRVNRVGLAQAARLIGVSRIELQAMAEAGEIRSVWIGRGYRLYEPDLVEWIVAQPVTPQAELGTPRDRPRRARRNP
jgi:excisionase family DNA binding protein